MLNTSPTSRIVWLDVVRLVAMFTVVCCHCADPFNFCWGQTPPDIDEIKFWGAAYGSLLRPCVPLFVMITGALLLPIKTADTAGFYRKRIGRVVWPFLLWSVLYDLLPYLLASLGLGAEAILGVFPYGGDAVKEGGLNISLGYLLQIPFNFSLVSVHMWYIYLLIGLYLYLPIFSAWVEKATPKAKRWFLIAWAVTTLLPYYREFVNPYLWGACSWNAFDMLYYFAGFNGYLLLGHYLRHHVDWSLKKTLLLGLPIFLFGYAVTFCGFRYITALPEYTDSQLELFFTYNSLNVVCLTFPVFMLLKKARVNNARIQQLLANLTTCGFGIYMIHYFFAGPAVLLAKAIGVPTAFQIPVAAVFAFASSWAIVDLLRRILGKQARYVIG